MNQEEEQLYAAIEDAFADRSMPQMNRATAQVQKAFSEEKGLAPVLAESRR